ncbi:hypothetical protein J8Z24_05075 [Pseudoalteromonas sp. SCSIO 43201]|uniref:hypothetical protein n=1 Tax=Pseudoalteromonas sp. SCSIO 43201 TaxID=2822842 RepID=UPI002075AF38|nr:hypothetical protein [Pseudoalteromonas sp. SCSIO 43201]USD29458.1 hypothetical protein J8Z24_05075 [Pseudoalteromonas sp. SCSIO 43201]
MAKLTVNNQVADKFYDPSTPHFVTQEFVEDTFGVGATFTLELSEDEAALQSKQSAREKIARQVADTDTLLGTTADTTQLLLNELSSLVTSLSTAQSLEDVRASVSGLKEKIGHIHTDVQSGRLAFPYQVKGEAQVMQEITERANGVSQALQTRG